MVRLGQVLHRAHTCAAPRDHVAASGKAWDTCKPLGRHFRDLRRVLLIDDDAFKVGPHWRGRVWRHNR